MTTSTAPNRTRLPDFIMIGATKCGTTSLQRWLRGHPDVFMPRNKELRYFTEEHHLDQGPDWYAGHFAKAPEGALIGEASNAYTRHPVYAGVAERIARTLPTARLLYMIRDPLPRIESHYRHRLATGIEWRSFPRAVRADPRYLAASLYGQQIAEYRRHFPAEQILVVRSEDLFRQPAEGLRRIADFLGIDASKGPAFVPHNVTATRPIAPWPLRRLAGYRRAKNFAKALSARVTASPARHLLRTADQPVIDLGPQLRAELADRLEADEALLADLVGPDLTYSVKERISHAA